MFENPRRALLFLIVLTLALRLGWAGALETTNDESYHYLYTVHPDLSYFDHPPMTMWVAKLGLLAGGAIVNTLTLRLGFVLLFTVSTWILARWTARWYGDWAGVYAATALNLAMFFQAAAGSFALPDGPFLFFALLTMWALSAALVAEPGRTLPWLLVGLAWGGALLSKYHALFLPMGALLYIAVTPAARRLLLRPGPYLAVAVGVLEFAPVLIWNSRHDWASFVFQGGRALGSKFRPDGVATMLVGPAILLMPWIWCGLAAILVSRLRTFRSLAGIERLLICLAIGPLAFFLAVSTVSPILPHWPLIGFVPLFPLLGARWAQSSATPRASRTMRRKIVGMASATLMLAVVVVAQVRLGVFSFPFRDPCDEMSGWESVGAELGRRGLLDDPDTFLFTTQWSSSGQLAFAARNRIPVLCYNATDPRGFAFWSQPNEWLHHNGLMITLDTWENEVALHKPFFRKVVKEAEFPMTRGGKPFRTVYVYRCIEQVYPFPFQYGPPPPPATGSAIGLSSTQSVSASLPRQRGE